MSTVRCWLALCLVLAAAPPVRAAEERKAKPAPAGVTPVKDGGAESSDEFVPAGAEDKAPKAAEDGTAAVPAEEAKPADGGPNAGALEIAQGLEAQRLGDHADCARLAWIAMTKAGPSGDKYESGQFVLGDCLAALGLNQAAAEYYFAVVEQRHTPALLPRALAGLEKLARRQALDEDKLLRGVLVEADLAAVSPEVADFLHFYRGLGNLRQGYPRWVDVDFGAIRPKSYYGHRSRLARVATMVKDGKIEDARTELDAIREEKPEPEIAAECELIKARLLYEAGSFEDAIVQYLKVKRTRDVPGGEILLERAWAHYRQGKYHDAMGLLYSLGSPSARDLFLPDQYVLRGLIYQRFCHFRAAKAAVDDFRAKYDPALQAIGAGTPPQGVEVVARAAEDIPEVEDALRIQRAVAAEAKILSSRHGALEDGGLAKHLDPLYEVLTARSERLARRALEGGSRTAAERLLEAEEQANLLEYEVGVSILRRVSDAAGKIGYREPAEVVPRAGDRIYYPFNGEYWSDELPDMRFLIQDRCVE